MIWLTGVVSGSAIRRFGDTAGQRETHPEHTKTLTVEVKTIFSVLEFYSLQGVL